MDMVIIGCSLVFLLLGVVVGWLARGNSWASRRDLAHQTVLSAELVQHQADTVSDTVLPVIAPLEESLRGFNNHMDRLEQQRLREFTQLTESVVAMQRTSHHLSAETTRLASALRSPNIRGQWGEIQLERIVELSGMAKHCDFTTQHYVRTGEGAQRPDMVITLAGDRTIVVDAKVPFDAYLTAVNATSQQAEQHARNECVRAVRRHIDALAKKSYWDSFLSSPEFVVLFVPGDPFLDTVVEEDPSLLDYAFSRNVVISTPTTLIALLKTVALTWRHDSLTRDAAEIHQLGTELYQRIDTVLKHFNAMGTQLGKTVDSYNLALGSVESRLTVTARKLQEHGISSVSPPGSPSQISSRPRAVSDK